MCKKENRSTTEKYGAFREVQRDMRDQMIQFLLDKYGLEKTQLLNAESFGELGIDSWELYSLINDIEEKFGLEIEIKDMESLDSPEKFLANCSNYIRDKEG